MSAKFLSFYHRYFKDVYRYVYSRLGNQWDTDDVVSEVFLKAFTHYNEKQANKAWLVTIARNCIVDHLRRSQHETALLFAPVHAANCDGDLDALEEKACLQKALESLEEEDTEIIRLRFFAGMTFKEISSVLGISIPAAKMRLYRTLSAVKEKVETCLELKN